jgi:hypothetical protein
MMRQETANALRLFLPFPSLSNSCTIDHYISETKSTFHVAIETLHSTKGKKQHATRSAVSTQKKDFSKQV